MEADQFGAGPWFAIIDENNPPTSAEGEGWHTLGETFLSEDGALTRARLEMSLSFTNPYGGTDA